MSTLTNDMVTAKASTSTSRLASGIGFALVAAASFGLSGSLAKGLMDLGWTAGSAVLLRVTIAALVLAIPGALALKGRWHLLAKGIGPIIGYGLFAVAGAQFFYFMAVQTLDVSIAMLIEYLAPVAVVLWLWMRKGHKPNRITAVGAAIAAVGLVLLINVFGGAQVSLVGIGWALAAMVGATVYFIVSGDDSNPMPPISLAAAGLAVAAIALGVAALIGVLPMGFGGGEVAFVPFTLPVWLVVLLLGVITAAVAYVAGIAATRRLGARLGSFVALTEVLAATIFAWILLGQAPAPIQIAGAALVLAGVVVVKLGEPNHDLAETTVEPLPISSLGDTAEPVPA
jgi:drug/metabolite transporter (DMT)-like permease